MEVQLTQEEIIKVRNLLHRVDTTGVELGLDSLINGRKLFETEKHVNQFLGAIRTAKNTLFASVDDAYYEYYRSMILNALYLRAGSLQSIGDWEMQWHKSFNWSIFYDIDKREFMVLKLNDRFGAYSGFYRTQELAQQSCNALSEYAWMV